VRESRPRLRRHGERAGACPDELSIDKGARIQAIPTSSGRVFTNVPERLRPSLRYRPMLLAWNSKFGPRARWSDSSHSREPMDANAASSADIGRIEIRPPLSGHRLSSMFHLLGIPQKRGASHWT